MNQFKHRQKQWLAKFVQQFRESFLASEMFILNKGLPYERFSETPPQPKYMKLSFFIGTQDHFSREEMYPAKKRKLVLRLLKATPIFCQHPAVFLPPCRQQYIIYNTNCFLEMVLNLHWALVAANWWEVAKQTKYPLSELIKGSIYNSGSVTKLSFLKITCFFKSYTQCHDLNVVSDDLHCVSKQQ